MRSQRSLNGPPDECGQTGLPTACEIRRSTITASDRIRSVITDADASIDPNPSFVKTDKTHESVATGFILIIGEVGTIHTTGPDCRGGDWGARSRNLLVAKELIVRSSFPGCTDRTGCDDYDVDNGCHDYHADVKRSKQLSVTCRELFAPERAQSRRRTWCVQLDG